MVEDVNLVMNGMNSGDAINHPPNRPVRYDRTHGGDVCVNSHVKVFGEL